MSDTSSLLPTLPALGIVGQCLAPAHWQVLDFLSDLHLQPEAPATTAMLTHYLAQTQADAVFLLGDLFELWVGDDALEEADSFETQCCALLRQAAQQRPLFFLPGNRDFLVGPGFSQHCAIPVLPDPTLLHFGGQRWLLSHGDALCLNDQPYQQFRAQARSATWQTQFLTQPLAQRRALGRQIRDTSEANKRDGHAIYADVDHAAALAWLQATQAHALIHGHTHCPNDHLLAPGIQRHVLSDWDGHALPPRAQVLRLRQPLPLADTTPSLVLLERLALTDFRG